MRQQLCGLGRIGIPSAFAKIHIRTLGERLSAHSLSLFLSLSTNVDVHRREISAELHFHLQLERLGNRDNLIGPSVATSTFSAVVVLRLALRRCLLLRPAHDSTSIASQLEPQPILAATTARVSRRAAASLPLELAHPAPPTQPLK